MTESPRSTRQALPSVQVSTPVQMANLVGVEGKEGGHPEGVLAVPRSYHSLSDQDHKEVNQSITDTSISWSGDGLPVATMSRKSRDSCQVHPGLKCGMMVPLVFTYEHKSFLFVLGIGLREVM